MNNKTVYNCRQKIKHDKMYLKMVSESLHLRAGIRIYIWAELLKNTEHDLVD